MKSSVFRSLLKNTMDGGFVEGVDVEGPTFVSKVVDLGLKDVSYQNEGELNGHEEMSNHDPNLDALVRTPVQKRVIDISMSIHGTPWQSTKNESPNKKTKLLPAVDGNH
jgi:hypothetical protein